MACTHLASSARLMNMPRAFPFRRLKGRGPRSWREFPHHVLSDSEEDADVLDRVVVLEWDVRPGLLGCCHHLVTPSLARFAFASDVEAALCCQEGGGTGFGWFPSGAGPPRVRLRPPWLVGSDVGSQDAQRLVELGLPDAQEPPDPDGGDLLPLYELVDRRSRDAQVLGDLRDVQ